jgi:hypothetical protein
VVAEISEALAAAGVNIEELAAEGVGGTAVAILAVDRYDEALRALAGRGFKAVSEDALVVQLDDRSGELARIAWRFNEARSGSSTAWSTRPRRCRPTGRASRAWRTAAARGYQCNPQAFSAAVSGSV